MELVNILLLVGVVGIFAVLYSISARDHERVTLKGLGGGTSSGDDHDSGRVGIAMAATKLSEGVHINLPVQSPPARVTVPARTVQRKPTAKPAAKRTAVAKVPVNGKKKDPTAPVRRRTRP